MKKLNPSQELMSQVILAKSINNRSVSFQNLPVWQKAHETSMKCYEFTKRFPKDEDLGITRELRLCALSIPASISEGFAISSSSSKLRLLNQALGQNERLKYLLLLSKDLGYGENEALNELNIETGHLVLSYIRSVQNNLALDFTK